MKKKNYKYVIDYLHNNYKVKPLHIMPPKMGTYVQCYDGQIKWMYFLIEDNDLLKKYTTLWDKASTDVI